MPTHRYTLAEFDPARPWVVVGEIRTLTVELPAGERFEDWAGREWPRDRYRVERLPELGAWPGS